MGYDKVVSLFVGQFHGGHATRRFLPTSLKRQQHLAK
jgi:hypothetical protein